MTSTRHPVARSAIAFTFALTCVLPPAVGATPAVVDISLTGQPTSWLVEGVPYQVAGYGHATFGMGVDQVRAVIAADYPAGVASLKDDIDAATHRRALTIVVPQLAPGPGAATINFVFGADSARLVAVNVSWLAEGQATPLQRAALVTAAQRVGAGLAGYTWAPLASVRGQLLPGDTLIVFAGKDAQGGGIEIRLDGVDVDVEPRTRGTPAAARVPDHRVAAPGPARLRVAYVAGPDQHDRHRLPDGAF